MSHGLLLISLSAALAVSAAASAEPTTVIERPAAANAAPASLAVTHGDPNRRVCKTLTATGSRLNKATVCKTAREWAEQQYEHQQRLDRMQRPRKPDGG
jgi:hypothetical protein